MEFFGLLLLPFIFISVPCILFVGIIAHLKNRDVFLWVLLAIFFIAPLILLILIFSPTLADEGNTDKSNDQSRKFRGEKDILSTAYVIYLTKKFDIEFNELQETYIVRGKLFENLTDALKFAKSLDVDDINKTRKKFSLKEKKNETNSEGNEESILTVIIFVVFWFYIGVIAAYTFSVRSPVSMSEDINSVSKSEFTNNIFPDFDGRKTSMPD